ncbi:helix-turn-helix domain-containing protein [Candidatus Phycosocius spiralis]|uniref:Transcriptional regulator n=1 Tax=Candidatus Phycosocius spiralis TaxID=2815099 RepID=A0ABQ4PXH9_9PROT|nr:helix-turn-helix transcriptional regulator [Candidatus Phycosocius spiralis]GIU67723.1 transcriptional regulator [Candidatus Phycosocius spiralis]
MINHRRSTSVDAYVGRRLKQRREDLELSQEKLSELLGLSFQQVQKYERGLNRVGASRLFQLCGILNVEPSFFFDGLTAERAEGVAESQSDATTLSTASLLAAPGALELLADYARLKSAGQRKKVLELIKILADDV